MTILGAHFRQAYKKLPLIQTFVHYYATTPWTIPKSIAELLAGFEQYCQRGLKAPFLIDLNAIDFATLKVQKALPAPQLIRKVQTKSAYCTIHPTLYSLRETYHQDDKGNILHIAYNNQHELPQLSKKLIKFAPANTICYMIMFAFPVQKPLKEKLIKLPQYPPPAMQHIIEKSRSTVRQQPLAAGLQKTQIKPKCYHYIDMKLATFLP